MNGSGSGNLDHFFARFHDLIGERNHFFLRERERELNHFLRELPIPWSYSLGFMAADQSSGTECYISILQRCGDKMTPVP